MRYLCKIRRAGAVSPGFAVVDRTSDWLTDHSANRYKAKAVVVELFNTAGQSVKRVPYGHFYELLRAVVRSDIVWIIDEQSKKPAYHFVIEDSPSDEAAEELIAAEIVGRAVGDTSLVSAVGRQYGIEIGPDLAMRIGEAADNRIEIMPSMADKSIQEHEGGTRDE